MQQNFPQQAPSFSVPSSLHPGLDARGPNWHVHGPHLACRNTPCGGLLFCQGCGTHGHSSADCRRRIHPNWNASGYYSDRYPGAGPLPYIPRPSPMQPQQFTPALQPVLPLQQTVPFQQPRIPPPPSFAAPSTPFPTPHRLNNITRSSPAAAASPAPAPSIQVNASTQLSADLTSAGGGVQA